jgi:NAD(P)-dependent dehydrogenase (short-subunit alcohol dehydrogenase family)
MTTFGAQTTTDDILEGRDLRGKVALVTGGASGIGEEAARALAARGARVIVPVRDAEKGAAALARLRAAVPEVDIDMMPCDLASLASVRAFAAAVLAKYDRLHLLINNAGVMASPLSRTDDGFEMQLGVCHIAHFLLTKLLTPALIAGAPARIVNLSSRGHQRGGVDFDDPHFLARPYEKWLAYGQAKTANILFSVELEHRLGPQGVHAYAVHPGVISTNLGRHLTVQDREELAANMRARGVTKVDFKTIAQGAATTVFAAVDDSLAGKGGVYLEDCHVASINDDPVNAASGVRSYALDAAAARRLWDATEAWIAAGGPGDAVAAHA